MKDSYSRSAALSTAAATDHWRWLHVTLKPISVWPGTTTSPVGTEKSKVRPTCTADSRADQRFHVVDAAIEARCRGRLRSRAPASSRLASAYVYEASMRAPAASNALPSSAPRM